MLIEIIILVVVVVWLATVVQKKAAPAAAQAEQRPVVTTPQQASNEGQRIARSLNIEGTETFKGSAGFLKQFNIPLEHVADVRLFRGPSSLEGFPPRVRSCLEAVFQEGGGRGLEMVEVLSQRKELQGDEAVYFVLVAPAKASPYIVGFVDKLRGQQG